MNTYSFSFNSIKVRLRPLMAAMMNGGMKFQFHKGTIKTDTWTTAQVNAQAFQFHKGTIKTGTIKTRKQYSIRHTRRMFQFHKGTIKTARLDSIHVYRRSFNSIKVRLRH